MSKWRLRLKFKLGVRLGAVIKIGFRIKKTLNFYHHTGKRNQEEVVI
jgi:hypothetical protein